MVCVKHCTETILRVRYEIKENQIIQGPVRTNTKRLGHERLNIF